MCALDYQYAVNVKLLFIENETKLNNHYRRFSEYTYTTHGLVH